MGVVPYTATGIVCLNIACSGECVIFYCMRLSRIINGGQEKQASPCSMTAVVGEIVFELESRHWVPEGRSKAGQNRRHQIEYIL